MPSATALLNALFQLNAAVELPPSHPILINVSSALHAAMVTLPDVPPFRASLLALNASRAVLPPLIVTAMAAIERYDRTGDTVGLLDPLIQARTAVGALDAAAASRPDETLLREGLATIDTELARMPPTQPTVDQLHALAHAREQLPELGAYLTGLANLASAATGTPSVDALSATWDTLNASLRAIPAYERTRQPLQQYSEEQSQLPQPPTALLDGALTLQSVLAEVPVLSSSGKILLHDTHDTLLESMNTLRLAVFGDELEGYTRRLEGMRPSVEVHALALWIATCLRGGLRQSTSAISLSNATHLLTLCIACSFLVMRLLHAVTLYLPAILHCSTRGGFSCASRLRFQSAWLP